MPVLGTRHHESVFGQFSGQIRTSHDVVPCEVEKDQEMFQNVVDRTDNVVSTLGQQNQKLSKDNTDLKRHLQLTISRLESDDSEIVQCQKEIHKHLEDLDTARKANLDYQKVITKEKEDHAATKKVLLRVQKELDTEMAALAEARTKIIKDLEDRNARLIEEARTERNSSTSLAQRLAASERRANDLQLKCDKLVKQLEEVTADNSLLLQEKEDMKDTLARERAKFEESLEFDRSAAQRQLDSVGGSLQAKLGEQNRMYRDAVEEMRMFKVHAHSTADEYKAFVDAQNDDIVRLKELCVAQASELERLFDSEMATRMKLEHIEDTIFLTEDQVALGQGRTALGAPHSTSTRIRTGQKVHQYA